MAALTVFGLPTQAETARVLTCLFEKDLCFGLVRREFYKVMGEHGAPAFPKYMQEPTGQVVIMEDDNGTMVSAGSRDICRHICTGYPQSGNKLLLGAGGLERASIEDWNRREAQLFDPHSTALILQLAFLPTGRATPASVEEIEHRLAQVLDGYDERLAENQYLAGDEFSLADLFHLPNTEYLYRTPLGCELINERGNVCRWWETISNRDSWKMVQGMQRQHPGDFENLPVPISPTHSTANGHDFKEYRSNTNQNFADMLVDEEAMHDQNEAYQRREHPITELDPYSTLIRAARRNPKRDVNPPVQPGDQNDRNGRQLGRKSSMDPYKKKTKGGDGKPRRK